MARGARRIQTGQAGIRRSVDRAVLVRPRRPAADRRTSVLRAGLPVAYSQGFSLLDAASKTYGWDLDLGRVAEIWREGCIIRSAFLGDINRAFDRAPQLANLLLDAYFKQAIMSCDAAWRRVVAGAIGASIPVPCLSAALAYWDGYRSAESPANLIQAQRDYFGAHQYERVDRPRGQFFHTNWTGQGGSTTSETYSR